jgi:PAS domain S-box-containing protein
MQSTDRHLPLADALFEHAACGLVVTDTDGRIVRANATFCEWIGYGAAELTSGISLQDLLTTGGKVFYQTHWAPLLQMQGSVAEVKLSMLHRDGHTVPTSKSQCSSSPIVISTSRSSCSRGVMRRLRWPRISEHNGNCRKAATY